MNDYKSIRASIYGRQSEKMKRIIDGIRKETEGLTADELGILSILIGLDRSIKMELETAGKVVKFPSSRNLRSR